MFRKAILAVSALTVIGIAALAPTAASAGGKHHFGFKSHHGWGHGHGYYPSYGYASYGHGCWVKKWIDTPYGPRLKRIYVCY
jgi:hypothetical protein